MHAPQLAMYAPQLAMYARPATQKGYASYAQGLAPPFCAIMCILSNLLFPLIPTDIQSTADSPKGYIPRLTSLRSGVSDYALK